MQLNWWEGGCRPAAFVHSPLLPKTAIGRWYNGTLHETDWLVTLLGLVNRAAGPFTLGVNYSWDGIDAWPALTGAAGQNMGGDDAEATELRTEALLAHNILRRGRYKLIAGSGTDNQTWSQGMLRDCMLGTGGGWNMPAELGTNGTLGLCPTSIYKVVEEETSDWVATVEPSYDVRDQPQISCVNVDAWGAPVDRWLCSEPCSRTSPCLYDVVSDPEERRNVAAQNPSVVDAMRKRLQELRKRFFYPGAPMKGDYCGTVQRNGYWIGPWT
eukprot:SAG31_NODE_7358_length_1711_cov_1.196650_3_plen_270_part_00